MNSRIQRPWRMVRRTCAGVLTGLIIWQWGAALHLQGKALMAQILISHAWTQKLQTPAETALPWPWADTEPVGRLQWLDNGVQRADQYVLAGAAGNSLAFGPGLMHTGSHGPARVIAGHRDTHLAFMQQLQSGDTLRWQGADGQWQYFTVSALNVVDSGVELFHFDPHENVLWLITCYPFDAVRPGGPLRYVIRAEHQSALAGVHNR